VLHLRARDAEKQKTMAERTQPPSLLNPSDDVLDDVDFCWQVAGDFETDFLLADGRLGPDLHVESSKDFLF
jgi:hypothetical protein